jgi:hypothetical protein
MAYAQVQTRNKTFRMKNVPETEEKNCKPLRIRGCGVRFSNVEVRGEIGIAKSRSQNLARKICDDSNSIIKFVMASVCNFDHKNLR